MGEALDIGRGSLDIDLDTFVAAAFRDDLGEGHVLLARGASTATERRSFWQQPYGSEAVVRGLKRGEPWYICVSTVKQPEPDPKSGEVKWKRRAKDVCAVYMVVFDDIGTKATYPPTQPSYLIETSPGNFQAGFFIQPTSEIDKVDALINVSSSHGLNDRGAKGSSGTRLVRVPGSLNIKSSAGGHRARVTEWRPELVWDSVESLADDLGLDWSDIERARTGQGKKHQGRSANQATPATV